MLKKRYGAISLFVAYLVYQRKLFKECMTYYGKKELGNQTLFVAPGVQL